MINDREYLERIARLALTTFHNGAIGLATTGRRLNQLRQAGYPVENYGSMNTEQRMAYLRSIGREIRAQAGAVCPEVLHQIAAENQKIRELEESLG